jgi:hypothetical protein
LIEGEEHHDGEAERKEYEDDDMFLELFLGCFDLILIRFVIVRLLNKERGLWFLFAEELLCLRHDLFNNYYNYEILFDLCSYNSTNLHRPLQS